MVSASSGAYQRRKCREGGERRGLGLSRGLGVLLSITVVRRIGDTATTATGAVWMAATPWLCLLPCTEVEGVMWWVGLRVGFPWASRLLSFSPFLLFCFPFLFCNILV